MFLLTLFTVTQLLRKSQVSLTLSPFPLELRSAFGTSHSSTTGRRNALFGVRVDDIAGYGETGLPPKKVGVYEANYADCQALFEEFLSTVTLSFSALLDQRQLPAVFSTDEQSIRLYTRLRDDKSPSGTVFKALLGILDVQQHSPRHAASSGIESAIFMCWCQTLAIPLHSACGLSADPPRPGFYTAALRK